MFFTKILRWMLFAGWSLFFVILTGMVISILFGEIDKNYQIGILSSVTATFIMIGYDKFIVKSSSNKSKVIKSKKIIKEALILDYLFNYTQENSGIITLIGIFLAIIISINQLNLLLLFSYVYLLLFLFIFLIKPSKNWMEYTIKLSLIALVVFGIDYSFNQININGLEYRLLAMLIIGALGFITLFLNKKVFEILS
ncbi:MAG: hypothetical protein QXW80_00320 [Candidatus Micrarchaeia archaeon]